MTGAAKTKEECYFTRCRIRRYEQFRKESKPKPHQGHTFTIEGQDKVALIDTGAGRCCMNEEQYQTLRSPPLEPVDVGFWLRTASGALMPGMGFLTCNLQIGGETYKQQFIICQQLTPGIILGRDFLSRNQLGITWGPEGVLQLRDKQDLSLQTAEEIINPAVRLAAKTIIPSRSWF